MKLTKLILLATIILFSSCLSNESIEGKWFTSGGTFINSDGEVVSVETEMTLDFNEQSVGAGCVIVTVDNDEPLKGSYAFKGDSLYLYDVFEKPLDIDVHHYEIKKDVMTLNSKGYKSVYIKLPLELQN